MATRTERNPSIRRADIDSVWFSKQLGRFGGAALITLFTAILATTFLTPFFYSALTSIKDRDQIVASARGSILPVDPVTFSYVDEEGNLIANELYGIEVSENIPVPIAFPVFNVPFEGETRQLALVRQGEADSDFVNPDNIEEGLINWQGSIDTLESASTTFSYVDVEGEIIDSELFDIPMMENADVPLAFETYEVPFEDGIRQLALLRAGRRDSDFIDPNNLEAGLINWEGSWRTLQRVEVIAPRWGNFQEVWEEINFPLLVRNTLAIALIGVGGTLISSICVAYAFARFPIPYKRTLFFILIATIILPTQVTLVPTYTFYARIGWVGTWLPLLVPHFFANAYNVFLIRQYFLSLPKELDEAAMIDGAGPLRILISVIIPQSWPVIVAVALFHTVFAWNDYFAPLIYLLGKPDLIPISIGIQNFNFQYGSRPHLIQATAIMGMLFPVIVFFLAQRVFMRGVVITGVDK